VHIQVRLLEKDLKLVEKELAACEGL
jgi:hypothetical protein